MSLKLADIKTEIDDIYKDLNLQNWKDKSDYRGITKRSQKDFDNLIPMYVRKIGNIREQLRGDWAVTLTPIVADKLKTPKEMGNELMEEIKYLLDKETRLIDKFAACVKEVEMRKDGDVIRKKLHDAANYYIDYANGTDSPGGTVHDGLAEPDDPGGSEYTAVDGSTTSTDSTHCCLALGGFDNDTDDNYNGDYLYNVTRSAGVIITDYDADDNDDASVLIHPEIVGQVAGDTFYILRAAKTITKFTTTEVRTAGDVLYLRANITWTQGTEAVDIICDEDGTLDSYIKIIGCGKVGDGDIDSWVDDNATLPIVDFEDAAFQIKFTSEHYWYLERIDFKQSADTTGALSASVSEYLYLKDCVFRDSNAASSEGVTTSGSFVTLDGCSFVDCDGIGLYILSGSVFVKSCTFNGGADVSTDYGISVYGTVYVEDTTFGATTTLDTADIQVGEGSFCYSRNNQWNTGITVGRGGTFYSEDDNQTFESHITTKYEGTITRGTTSPRIGGADSFAIMASNANCGLNSPLILGDILSGFAKVWLTKDVQVDISIYARVDSAWDSALIAAECYTKFSYLSNAAAGNATRTEVNSTEQIANDTTWTALTSGNFTPLQTGWVYVWFYLKEYEDATEKVDVDIKPVIS